MWVNALTDNIFNQNTVIIEFKNDEVLIRRADSGLSFVVNTSYKINCKVETTAQLQVEHLRKVKVDEVTLHLDGNKVIGKSGITKISFPVYVEPDASKYQRDMIKLGDHPHTDIELTNEVMLRLLEGFESSKAYVFELKDGTLYVHNQDVSDFSIDVEYPCGIDGEFKTIFGGDYLINIFKNFKSFTSWSMTLGNNIPSIFTFSNDVLTARYGIAHRIEPED